MKTLYIFIIILSSILLLFLIIYLYNNRNKNKRNKDFSQITALPIHTHTPIPQLNPSSIKNIYYAKSWNTISPSGNLSYPEFYSSNLYGNKVPDINKVSICISGGGTRSFCVSMGYFRALNKMGYKNKAEYISSVSGGSWFYSVYSFYQTYGNIDTAMGQSCGLDKNNIPDPSLMTLNELNNKNKDLENYLGNIFSTSINDLLQEYLTPFSGVAFDNMWNKIIFNYILKPLGLDKNVPISLNKMHADDIYKRNPNLGYPLYLNDDMPFWICNSTLLFDDIEEYPYLCVPLTPLYSGIIQEITKSDKTLGGMAIENFAFGNTSVPKKLPINISSPIINSYILSSDIRNLSDSIGTSSWATASFFYEPDLIPYIGNLLPENIDAFLSHYNILIKSKKDLYLKKYYLGDGAFSNNSGILSLLSRGVKHIISFVNANILNPEGCETTIKPLFGVLNDRYCKYSILALDDVKVFSSEDYINNIYPQFQKTFKSGGPSFARASLNVLENKNYGISSYNVDILFIILEESSKFNSQLPPEIKSQIGTNYFDDFQNFPNFSFGMQNIPDLLYYTLGQVNLLSSYTEWCLSQPELKVHIDEMFSY
jgi:hypothetical protein